jgi:alcohol dehydrogenase (NADP+)
VTSTPALAVAKAGASPERTTIRRRAVGAHDVSIDIAYAGICHSDIHQAEADWGDEIFPMVPGHEIAGTVVEVGPEVTGFQVGDRVGVGCMVDSCGQCEYCKAGEEQYCTRGCVLTYNGRYYDGEPTYGGYSRRIVVTDRFVVRIPDSLDLAAAAPLLCAGITTYSPLRHWKAGLGRQVAVVGMGGLGHLAVKIANALGAEVTVLSRSLSKQADGARFGADHYHATADPATFTRLAGTFDLILNTVSENLPVDDYLSLLRVDGAMVNVGAPAKPDTYQPFSLIGARRSLAGSSIGGVRETQQMLDFCAEHGITAEIEMIGAGDVPEAWDRVKRSDVRYRFVIDTASLGE